MREPTHYIHPTLPVTGEHDWHACSVPLPPTDVTEGWRCRVCKQVWVWRRPPRPAPQWVRREGER